VDNRSAFSITDLVIVTAVAVLMLGVLTPTVCPAVRTSRVMTCTKNVKIINVGVQFYLGV